MFIHLQWFNCFTCSCVKLLLERGGSCKIRDAKGWNALYWASSKGSLNCVQLLLEQNLEYGDFIFKMVSYFIT